MTKAEMSKIAELTATMVVERLQQLPAATVKSSVKEEEYVTASEAARILRISPLRLRQIKDRLPHRKVGNNQQGRLLFLRAGLQEKYING